VARDGQLSGDHRTVGQDRAEPGPGHGDRSRRVNIDRRNPLVAHRPGPLGRLAGVAYRRRGHVVLGWVAALAVAIGLSAAFAGEFTADYSTPGSDSKQAQDQLEQRFPEQSGDTVHVVVRADQPVTSAAVRSDVTGLLDELRGLPHVAAVDDPYPTPGGIAEDGQTLIARLNLDVINPVDMPVEDTEELLAAADAAERPGLEVALGGQTIQQAEQSEIGSEGIAFAVAALILLVTFGSVVAAGLPLGVALAGLAVSGTLTGVIAALTDVPDWSTALATMMGIALGIDYTLLMVTRFREWRAVGLEPEAATVATLDTAGRAVLVAGGTVLVSMLGLFAMGLSFMRGAALVTIVAVFTVMAAAMTLFPALLGYLGRWVDRLRLPMGHRGIPQVAAGGHLVPARGWSTWTRLIDRHSIVATVVGAAVLLVLAAPFLGVRYGFPDAGNDPPDKSSRQAYDMVAEAFGVGANGPLLVAAEASSANDTTAVQNLATAIDNTAGVAAAARTVSANRDATLITVIPETGPQDEATEDLVRTLRDDVIPDATDGTGVQAHVGGVTATNIDANENFASRLPYLIGGVIMLSMLLLLAAFRSIAIPLTAAVMNLLSVAAAYGVMAYVLEGGWAGQLLGIDTETPMPGFIPVIVFAVLFGLSMDYEVFLISRMREAWTRTGDNTRAVQEGLAGTGRVITAAAAIMIAVFAAFVPSPDIILKVIGLGMATAVLVDATVVRMLLVPALMHLLGPANWWLPRSLQRRLPQLYVEGRPERYLPAPDHPPGYQPDRDRFGAPA
jgi:putative drug exporter of the RND superfamily